MVTFENANGATWSMKLDEQPLRELLGQIAEELDQDAQDARLAWDGGALSPIRESKEGRKLDADAALTRAREALESDNHQVALPVEVAKPAVDMRDATSMGIVELIDSATTSFAGSIPEKQHNIRLAASKLNGVVVAPGETFSFNKEVGPTTVDAGFEWGYGLESGGQGKVRTVPSVAGGICQVATTLFQPVFWGGYQIEERNWHLYWIPAYTSHDIAGLDATVDQDAGLDFKFVNNTSNHVLIQSWSDESSVTFALYGTTPSWKVEVDTPVIANERKADPKVYYEEQPNQPYGWRLQVSSARDGFDTTIVRRVTQDGDVRTLRLGSSYQPSRNVILIGTQDKPDGVSLDALLNPPPDPEPEPVAEATPEPKPTKETADKTRTPAEAASEATPSSSAVPVGEEGVVQGGAPAEEATAQPTPHPKPTATKKKSGKARPTRSSNDNGD
jgi:vancomycin resistance protein YoaR